MNAKPHKETICHQFDSFCKKILKYRARDYYRKDQLNKSREISLESISACALEKKLTNENRTTGDSFHMVNHINICEIEISIFDDALFMALDTLSVDQKRIILLYYFFGYNDREIAEMTNNTRRTMNNRRRKALDLLKFRIEADLDYG